MIEAITLYNKLLGTSFPLNMSRRDFVLQSVDFGVIESSRKSYKFINQVGVYVTGTTLESRTIEIVGWIVADTIADMKRRKQFLNSFINPLQRIIVYYNDYRIEGIPEATVQYGTKLEENNEVMCKFMLSLFCPDPMFYDKNETNVSIAYWAPKFRFPLVIPKNKGIIMGLRSPSTIVTVANNGAASCGMVITFEASGTVVNPKLININTQERIQFDYTMSNGEVLQVSTVENNKTVYKIVGETSENAFNLLDFESTTFFSLNIGNNFLRYDADSGLNNLTVKVQYSPRYLEVQE